MKPGLKLFSKFFLFVFACLSALPGIAANHQYDFLIDKKYEERADTLLSIRGVIVDKFKADGAVREFDELAKWAKDEGDERLSYSFKLMKCHTLVNTPGTIGQGVENDLLALIKQLKEKNYIKLEAEAMHLLAYYYWIVAKDYGRGFEYSMSAYDIYSEMPEREFPLKFNYLYDHGGKFYHFKDYPSAKKVFHEAYVIRRVTGVGLFNLLNVLALCYREMHIYDSAVYYFREAYKDAEREGNVAYVGIISGNIGITYYYQKRYDEAIPLLETDIRLCIEYDRASINAMKSLAILADIYLVKGNMAKAQELLEQSYDIIKIQQHWGEYEKLSILYSTMAKAYRMKGNMTEAYRYMDSAMVVKNKLAIENNALILAGAQHQIERERHMAELNTLTDEKEKQVLLRNSMLVVVVLSGVIGLLFINRQKIVHRRNAERLASERRLLDAELEHAGSQLNMFTRSIHEKNELIEKFAAELETVKGTHPTAETDNTETLLKLQESTILTDEEWENFRKLFEKVHGGFLWRLKEKLPGLSPAETRFMALSKLKLSNKEMAGILGISVDAVRMNKHRLRKKLNLPEEETVEDLIDQL